MLVSIANWIYKKPQGSEYWLLPLAFIAWDQLYNIVVTSTLMNYTNVFSKSTEIATVVEEEILVTSLQYPLELILGATFEELLFRIIPLSLLLLYTKSRLLMFIAVGVSSVLFAFDHGGPIQLLLQGIGGIIYCIFFIKYSENGTRLWQASALVILLHIIFNALSVLISVSGGGTTF